MRVTINGRVCSKSVALTNIHELKLRQSSYIQNKAVNLFKFSKLDKGPRATKGFNDSTEKEI